MGCACSAMSGNRVIPHVILPPGEGLAVQGRSKSMLSTGSCISELLGVDKSRIVVPFNSREIFLLSRSWEKVREDLMEAGTKVFTKMFENSPAVREVFEKFSGLNNQDKLWQAEVVHVHGLTVMTAMDEIMNNLDDKDALVELVLDQGTAHAHFGENLQETIFAAIEQPFLITVHEILGSKYKGELKTLYERALNFIMKGFLMGFRESRRAQKEGQNFDAYLSSRAQTRLSMESRRPSSVSSTSIAVPPAVTLAVPYNTALPKVTVEDVS